jgi:hypothetical protein
VREVRRVRIMLIPLAPAPIVTMRTWRAAPRGCSRTLVRCYLVRPGHVLLSGSVMANRHC